jgi:hypothetical protein
MPPFPSPPASISLGSGGVGLEGEVTGANRVTVSGVVDPRGARVCESAEAGHSAHDTAHTIAQGTAGRLGLGLALG